VVEPEQKGEGFEYLLVTIALAFLIMVGGAGALSIDHLVFLVIPEEAGTGNDPWATQACPGIRSAEGWRV
jgi:hypothetical protein